MIMIHVMIMITAIAAIIGIKVSNDVSVEVGVSDDKVKDLIL